MIEILSPAGGMEQLTAAVRCGADAVYLGAKGFNARQNAENFPSLKEAVSYCHARGAAVHVTVNTLVAASELDAVCETLREAAEAGADAVITQDLAVARLVRECCPSLALHASTQMAVHNPDGVKLLESFGFSRVVLARELDLREIEAICRATPLEVECFVHGALCMSLSGACYLSAMLGGRSGNRGLCAQPCRLDFRCAGRDHALSLKDACNIPHMQALENAGVRSLKIEGRMKRPEYVAAATLACVDARAGRRPDLERLRAVFSRSGFTDGYLTGRRTLDMFGFRTREDVTAAASVLRALENEYRDERPRVPVRAALDVGETAALTVTDGTHTVRTEGQTLPSDRTPNPALLEKGLGKTGGTPFLLESASISADTPAMLPASELNRMRREALDALLRERERVCPHPWEQSRAETLLREAGAPLTAAERLSPDVPVPCEDCAPVLSEKSPLRLRFSSPEQVFDDGASDLILPVERITPDLCGRYGVRLIAELPVFCAPAALEPLRRRLLSLRDAGLCRVCADNLYAVQLARSLGLTVHGGPCLNLFNPLAARTLASLGLADGCASFELSFRWLRELAERSVLPVGMLVYGRLPLMRLRACPKNDCARCQGRFNLTDRMGVSFPVVCRERQFQTVYNSVPLYAADRRCPPSAFRELYFTTETREQAGQVAALVRAGKKPGFPKTNGLYERGLASAAEEKRG